MTYSDHNRQGSRSEIATPAVGAAGIEVAMITVHREPNYLHDSIASYFDSDPLVTGLKPIELYIGSPETAYLGNLMGHDHVDVKEIMADDWSRIKDWHVHARLAYNYHRALSSYDPDAMGRLVCEDDIIFADGFVSHLMQAINEVHDQQGSRFILAIYSHYDFDAEPARKRGKYYCSYCAPQHYGNCCLYFSTDILADLCSFMRNNTVENHHMPTDIAVGAFAEQMWQQGKGGMYQTVVSLAQHVGVVSGGTSGRYSFSPTFGRSWPE